MENNQNVPVNKQQQTNEDVTKFAGNQQAITGVFEDVEKTYRDEDLPDVEQNNAITNNDGSIIETLDTALHGEPGFIDEHSPVGSNRADYYEARADGKSDVEEETAYLRKKQQE